MLEKDFEQLKVQIGASEHPYLFPVATNLLTFDQTLRIVRFVGSLNPQESPDRRTPQLVRYGRHPNGSGVIVKIR